MEQSSQSSGAPGAAAPDFNAPAPAAPAAPAPAAPAPAAMQDGGETTGGFWEGVTILNVGIIALTALALFYNIYYSRQRIFYLRNEKTQDRKDIEALKEEIQSLTARQYQTT